TIVEARDAGANLVAQKKPSGVVVSEAEARSAGRLKNRKVWTSGTLAIATQFGYADGSAPGVPLPSSSIPPATGLPLWSATSVAGVTIGGSSNARDAAKRLDLTRDLGTGSRLSAWDYDALGRVTSAWLNLPQLS